MALRNNLLSAFGLVALAGLAVTPLLAQQDGAKPKQSKALKAILASKDKYAGASKCKMCHKKESTGNAYGHWQKSKHHLAFETLKGDQAMKYAKERGIEDPTKAPECLKCHVTAYGLDPARTKKIKPEDGVQCETCHGPGTAHMKARMKAAAKKIVVKDDAGVPVAPGEMQLPDEGLCRSCHNPDSPGFKEFDFGERLEKIRHMHPLRKVPRVQPPKKDQEEEGEEHEEHEEDDD